MVELSPCKRGVVGSNPTAGSVTVAQAERALDCGSKGRGFKSLQSPHLVPITQLARVPDF